jgi:deoxycytidylate deaminase
MTAPSFMDLALKAAETAGKSAEVPIGCVIVLNNEVIATAGNRTLTDHDPTAHAEILAIRQATSAVGSERLVDCDLYVTLEPCTMCAGAISLADQAALLRRGRPQGRRGGFRCQVLCLTHLPPHPRGLFGGGRTRSRDVATGFL